MVEHMSQQQDAEPAGGGADDFRVRDAWAGLNEHQHARPDREQSPDDHILRKIARQEEIRVERNNSFDRRQDKERRRPADESLVDEQSPCDQQKRCRRFRVRAAIRQSPHEGELSRSKQEISPGAAQRAQSVP